MLKTSLKHLWAETANDFLFAAVIAALGFWQWLMISVLQLTDETTGWKWKVVVNGLTIVVGASYLAFRGYYFDPVLLAQTGFWTFITGPLFNIATVNAICCKHKMITKISVVLMITFFGLRVVFPNNFDYTGAFGEWHLITS